MDRIGHVLEKRPLPMGTSAVLALQYFGSSIFWRDRVGRVIEKSPIFYQKKPTKSWVLDAARRSCEVSSE